MLKQRILTGALGVPLIIFAIWFGAPWFSLLIAAAVLVGAFEFYRMANFEKKEPLIYFGLLWALSLVLSPLYKSTNILPIVMSITILISLILLLFRTPRDNAFHKWAWTIAGAIFVGWMLSYWISLRGLENGRDWVYLAMLTIFANDTGAFFIGRAKGKHKLVPAISPAKTWEGAIGGLVSSILGSIIIVVILNLISPFTLKYWQVIPLGFLISFFAQIGDLVESLLKRNMGIKESGTLLPGHGGILDRFDSLIFVGPVVYYFVIGVV